MSLNCGLRRLALTFFERGLSRRNIGSLPSKCSVTALSRTHVLPPLATVTLRAPSIQPNQIDPSLVKGPLTILDLPFENISRILDVPIVPTASVPTSSPAPAATPAPIEDPTQIVEKQAARLIVIRRRKMRRHKLKKLRIRMKFFNAKVRQKRELKKEKEFQAELMGKIREAESFDAAAYAAEKLRRANEVLIPKLWRGKRLPEFVIKELIEESKVKRAEKLAKLERRKTMLTKVSDYKV